MVRNKRPALKVGLLFFTHLYKKKEDDQIGHPPLILFCHKLLVLEALRLLVSKTTLLVLFVL